MKTDIVLAGVGGQGILSIATILANAALAENLHIKQAEVHGMSQRGGDVHSMLRLSSDPIASDLIRRGTADLVVSLEPMEALRYVPFLSKKGWIVTNTVPFLNIEKYPEMETVMADLERHGNVVAFDVDTVAKEVASPRTSNMVLLGAASPFIELDADAIERAIATVFGPKGDAIVEMNVKAFRAGRERALAKK
ncbi:MAG: indolepyruvate oxidoreductase subunit beta [Muribaculaceae bacterium]|jgi:indolepyruvate ferredoxin oxidoreductase beta subunit|nr:indolepyruvate oxidoreductase subunit beta [Prevotella sp.]CCX44324.1 indolepyruvate oxidoreductase subunit beta [Prevotella sp. CAG:1031]